MAQTRAGRAREEGAPHPKALGGDRRSDRIEAEREMIPGLGEEVFTDEASGKTTEGRDGLERMLMKLRKGDEVYAVRLDRLGRSTRDLLDTAEKIKDAGATLQVGDLGLDTSTTTGEFMLTVIAVLKWRGAARRSRRDIDTRGNTRSLIND